MNSPASHKHLPSADHLRQWDGAIALPVLNSLGRVDEDDEVVVRALVVNLHLGVVAAHIGGLWLLGEMWSFRWSSVSRREDK